MDGLATSARWASSIALTTMDGPSDGSGQLCIAGGAGPPAAGVGDVDGVLGGAAHHGHNRGEHRRNEESN